MSRAPPRLQVHPTALAAARCQLEAAQAHYVCHVLRLRPGDAATLFDGDGHSAAARLLSIEPCVLQREGAVRRAAPGPHLTVACSLPKGERGDWLVEKLTELGAARLHWVACARSVVRPGSPGRGDRHARLAAAAARQAGRDSLPEITGPTPLSAFLAAPDGGLRLVGVPGATPLPQVLAAAPRAPQRTLLIGPEGGLSPEELQEATAAGYIAVGLSPFTLRVETAAVAGLALLVTGAMEAHEPCPMPRPPARTAASSTSPSPPTAAAASGP